MRARDLEATVIFFRPLRTSWLIVGITFAFQLLVCWENFEISFPALQKTKSTYRLKNLREFTRISFIVRSYPIVFQNEVEAGIYPDPHDWRGADYRNRERTDKTKVRDFAEKMKSSLATMLQVAFPVEKTSLSTPFHPDWSTVAQSNRTIFRSNFDLITSQGIRRGSFSSVKEALDLP